MKETMTNLHRYNWQSGMSGGPHWARDDKYGEFVKWADVSSRLQQLEDRKREAECDAQSALEGTHAAQWDRDQALRTNDDLKARVEQLEQEKATLQKENTKLRIGCLACSVNEEKYSVAAFCSECYHAIVQGEADADAELSRAEAALAETREALQQAHELIVELNAIDFDDALQARVDAVLIGCTNPDCARVDKQADSLSVVPQSPTEPSSTPSPVKVEKL